MEVAMVRNLSLLLASLTILTGLLISSAQALPMGASRMASMPEDAFVHRAHGWHHFCAWGPARFHRHVPGYGNVPCYRPPRWHRPRCMIEPWLCRPRHW
jgi:hypothetical protein